MFCLAMRRDAYERIGPLDERFEVGMFEDDDYAMRGKKPRRVSRSTTEIEMLSREIASLRSALAGLTESGQRDAIKLRKAVKTGIELRRRIQELTKGKEADQLEIVQLRKVIKEQSEELNALASRIDPMLTCEEDLREMLLCGHGEVLRCFDQIENDIKATAGCPQLNAFSCPNGSSVQSNVRHGPHSDLIQAGAAVLDTEAYAGEQTKPREELTAKIEIMLSNGNILQEMVLAGYDEILQRLDRVKPQPQRNGSPTGDGDLVSIASAVSRSAAGRSTQASYEKVIQRIRSLVSRTLPGDATVITVSRGDPELLKLAGRRAWHFPQQANGVYAGYYPADSAAAIEHLEALKANGGQFLLFPSTALWWLGHYQEFKQHLKNHYRLVVYEEDTCVIFALD